MRSLAHVFARTSVTVFLGAAKVRACRTEGLLRQRMTPLVEFDRLDSEPTDAWHAPLAEVLRTSGCNGAPLRYVIEDRLTHLFVVEPPANAASIADCRAAARLCLQTVYDAAPEDFRIEAAWDDRAAFFACALPLALLASLQRFAADSHATVLGITPQFVIGFNRWHKQLGKQGSWFADLQGNRLTLAAIDAGKLLAIRSLALPGESWQTSQWLARQVRQEALRLGVAAPAELDVAGVLPGQASTKPVAEIACVSLSLMHAEPAQAA